MVRPLTLLLVGIAALSLVLGGLWFQSWGAFALLAVAIGGWAWYRVQVRRSEEAAGFFGDDGEETRVTALHGNSPSEMPVDAARRGGVHDVH